LANPVLLRQEILGKVREAIGTVEFEIPYIFVLKKDNSKFEVKINYGGVRSGVCCRS